jgi:hypothetical protein
MKNIFMFVLFISSVSFAQSPEIKVIDQFLNKRFRVVNDLRIGSAPTTWISQKLVDSGFLGDGKVKYLNFSFDDSILEYNCNASITTKSDGKRDIVTQSCSTSTLEWNGGIGEDTL